VAGELGREERVGPWLVRLGAETSAALDPGDGQVTWLPGGVARWFWDAPRSRFLGARHEAGAAPQLVSFTADAGLAELLDVAARTLTAGEDRVYVVTERDALLALDPHGWATLWQVELPRRVDVAPTLLDTDGDGAPDRVLLLDSHGGARLIAADDGARVAEVQLPGPVGYAPALLEGTQPPTLLVGCSDGWLVRLRVSSDALEEDARVRLDAPITAAPALFRDGTTEAATHVAVATDAAGLNAWTVGLDALVWAAGPPEPAASPRGEVVAHDFDGDGADELAVFWHAPAPARRSWVFSPRGRRLLPLRGGPLAALPGGPAAAEASTVRAWGRWDSLPDPEPRDVEHVIRNLLVGAWVRAYEDAVALPWTAGRRFREYLDARLGELPPHLVEAVAELEERAGPERQAAIDRQLDELGLRGAAATEAKRRHDPANAIPLRPIDPQRLVREVQAYRPTARSLDRLLESIRTIEPPASPPERALEVRTLSGLQEARGWSGLTGEGAALEAQLELAQPETLDLILDHRVHETAGWGFALVTLTRDGEPVVERYAPPTGTPRSERFPLGELGAGTHTIRLQLDGPSGTPYELLALRLIPSGEAATASAGADPAQLELEGDQGRAHLAGPWLIFPGAASALRLADGTLLALPAGVERCLWDDARDGFLATLREPPRLATFTPGEPPQVLAAIEVRGLAVSAAVVYAVTQDRELLALDPRQPAPPRWRIPLPERVDVDPLLFDADGDGAPDRVLVIGAQGAALLVAAEDGAELARAHVGGPVRYPPALLGSVATPAELVVACTNGQLTRLTVSPQRLDPHLGCLLDSAITAPPVLFRDGSRPTATHVAVATDQAGLNALSVGLSEVLWAAGPPLERAALRGQVVALDADGDGADELAVSWSTRRGETQAALFSTDGKRLQSLGWGQLWPIPRGLVLVSGATVRIRARVAPLGDPEPADRNRVDRNLIAGAWRRAYEDTAELPWAIGQLYLEFLSAHVPQPDPELLAKLEAAKSKHQGQLMVDGLARIERMGLASPEKKAAIQALVEATNAAEAPPLDPQRLLERLQRYRPSARSLDRLSRALALRPPPAPPMEHEGLTQTTDSELPAGLTWPEGWRDQRFCLWFDDQQPPSRPPLARGLTLRAAKLEAGGRQGAGGWLEASFELERAEPLDLILRHRAADRDGWGFTQVTITLDGEPVSEGYAPPAAAYAVEGFSLGRLTAGKHTVRIAIDPQAPTPYELLELRLEPPPPPADSDEPR
jgi:outer membrane protein assembly factor BamB